MTIMAVPLIQLAAAAACLLVRRRQRWVVLTAWTAGLAFLVYWITVVAASGPIRETVGNWGGMGIHLIIDRPALVFLLLEQLLAGAVIAYTWRGGFRSTFYALLLVLIGTVSAVCMSMDLFNIYVLLELLTLTSFLLVAYEKRPVQIWASLKYLLLASLGMSVYLLGVALLYARVGSLDLAQVGEYLAALPAAETRWLPVAAALMTAGIAVKAGIFMFSLWLPGAHGSANSAVSALLSGLVIKVGILVLYRLSAILPIGLSLTVLGAITGITGVVYAVIETDIKKMLAFCTLSQVGYLLVGIGAGTRVASAGFLMYVLAHGMFKGLLFLAAGDAVEHAGTTIISQLRIRRREIPAVTRIALLIGSLAIAGFPFLGGFWAKDYLLAGSGVVEKGFLWLFALGTAVSFSRLLPIAVVREHRRGSMNRAVAYGLLGIGLPGVFALTGLLIPGHGWLPRGIWSQAGLSMAVIAIGTAIGWRAHGLRKIHLPRGVFRIEGSIIAILAGFFLVYSTVLIGR